MRKLAAARARLALERPFVGALVMHLPLVASDRARTIATDARALYFSSAFIDGLSFAETQFMLAHEALHCALGHFHRGRHRVRSRWDSACDYCVNQLLADDGMTPPARALLDPKYRGMAAEEIYAVLDEGVAEGLLDEHWFMEAHREGLNEVLTTEQLQAEWQDRLASSALEAMQTGRLGPALHEALDRLVQPRLPWRTLLARFLTATGRDDYSFERPSRREGAAILPGLRSARAEVVVALDTSGSVSRDDFREFLDEIDALRGQVHARVTLVACDAALAPDGPWQFEAWERIELPPDLAGGGGTRFTPVFEWVCAQAMRPEALLYFTDGQGEFPANAPDYPVLWLVKGNAPVPWGERVQLN
jgi:predicted metal-dependent peptidase